MLCSCALPTSKVIHFKHQVSAHFFLLLSFQVFLSSLSKKISKEIDSFFVFLLFVIYLVYGFDFYCKFSTGHVVAMACMWYFVHVIF